AAEQHIQCARMTVRGAHATVDWSNRRLASYTGPCVYLNGHVYGVNRSGLLTCMNWQSGAVAWAQSGFGSNGALIAADGMLFVQTSTQGDLVVVRADPEGYTELRRFRAFEGKAATFTPPVIAGGRLYCRSYAGEVVCLQICRKAL
ncbi:MAG: PQQ-like beta-propeller repeat protein, partial [Armatimonadetes bacterium]|nr:PQQ-like beta-propeller repeat protein [Armatimonadota bacterium]